MLHRVVFQIEEGIMISVFTSQLTVQVPVLSNFCPVEISLYIPSHQPVSWGPHTLLTEKGLSETPVCRCKIDPWLRVHRWMRMGLFQVRLSCLC